MTVHTIMCLAAVFAAAGPAAAAADTPKSFPQLPSSAVIVDDSVLAGIRGKYIPPGTPDISSALTPAQRGLPNATSLDYHAASGASTPLSSVRGSGPVVYFGVQMVSTWSVGTGAAAQGVQVGGSLGIDVSTKTVTIDTWSSSTNGGLQPVQGANGVNGSPLNAGSSGVGQSIQVSGNGNVVVNEAGISYGTGSVSMTPVPTINTCGTVCTAYANGSGVGVEIALPQGVVGQSIGANGITQNAQLWSDMNSVTNQMGVNVQLAPGNAAPAASLSPNQMAQLLPGVLWTP